MIYTTKENESFDAEILRQELVAAIGADGWHLNTAGNQVEFVGEGDPEATILAHFANGEQRRLDREKVPDPATLPAQITQGEWNQLKNVILLVQETLYQMKKEPK